MQGIFLSARGRTLAWTKWGRFSFLFGAIFLLTYSASAQMPWKKTGNWGGMSQTQGVFPPDPHGAVGTAGIIQTVNLKIAYLNRAGGVIWGPVDLHNFWAGVGNTGNANNSDPHTQFDSTSGHFYVVMLENLASNSFLCVAVSRTANPRSGTSRDWFFYRFEVTEVSGGVGYGIDYPQLGFDSQAVYVTCNMFTLPFDSPSVTFKNCQIIILDKASITSGTLQFSTVFTPDTFPFTLQPATVRGTNNPGNVAYFGEVATENSTTVRIWTLTDPLVTAALSYTTVTVPDNGGGIGAAPQRGTTLTIDTVSPNTQGNAFWLNGSVWFCNTGGGSSGYAKVFYYNVDVTSSPTLVESGAIDAGTGIWNYQPSIGGNDRGDICIVYTQSSSNAFPAIYTVARSANSSLFTPPILVKKSATFNAQFRWGDFASVTPDPVDQTFWVTHQWMVSHNRWSTWWAHIVPVVDKTRPTLAITGLPASRQTTNDTLSLTGRARDDFYVTNVFYSVNGSAFLPATGTTNWTADIPLTPGTNIIKVFAVDQSGNDSLTNTFSFFYTVLETLTLETNGVGRIVSRANRFGTPRDQAQLPVGRSFQEQAVPASGNLFSNWVSIIDTNETVLSTKPLLTFLMQTGLVLQANFVTNIFIAAKGTYAGLSIDTNGFNASSSGLFALALTSSGGYSGYLKVDGGRYSFSGKFNVAGVANNTLARKGKTPLALKFALINSNQIDGIVTNASWSANLAAARTISAGAFAGRYTLALAGFDNPTNGPPGKGAGTVIVNKSGVINFVGSLPDGTSVSQSVGLTAGSQWPFYVPIYRGFQGLVAGQLAFTNGTDTNIAGSTVWIKPAGATTTFYSGGFTNPPTAVFASPFQARPSGQSIFDTNISSVEFLGGDLNLVYTNQIALNANNQVSLIDGDGPVTNKFTLNFARGSGVFTGRWIDPQTKKATSYRGVVLQDQNAGFGYFLGTTQGGAVSLSP